MNSGAPEGWAVKHLQRLIYYYVTEFLTLVFAVVIMYKAGEEFPKRVTCTKFDMYGFIIIVIEKKIEWLFVFVIRKA